MSDIANEQTRYNTMEASAAAEKPSSSSESEEITLYVGSGKTPLWVTRETLNKIPFFKACLDAPMQESITGVINLPDDDYTDIDAIMDYHQFSPSWLAPSPRLFARCAIIVTEASQAGVSRIKHLPTGYCQELIDKTISKISLYETAHKYGAAALCQAIIANINAVYQYIYLDIEVLEHAIDQVGSDHILSRTFFGILASQLRTQGWEGYGGDKDVKLNAFLADPENAMLLVQALANSKAQLSNAQ